MDAYGGQEATASTLYGNIPAWLYKEEPSRQPCDRQHRVFLLARSDRGHLISAILLNIHPSICTVSDRAPLINNPYFYTDEIRTKS